VPPLPRFRAVSQRREDEQKLERIVARADDTTRPDPKPVNGAGGGDPRRMRGFPIVGVRGEGGTSPGTDPVRALIVKEGQRRSR
jgi:hypothetical protein